LRDIASTSPASTRAADHPPRPDPATGAYRNGG
jgi:hypothetical protein